MVPSRGSVAEWIPCLMQGVKQGLHKLGYPTLRKIPSLIDSGGVHLERRSAEAKREGNPHSLFEIHSERVASFQAPPTPKSTLTLKTATMRN